MMALDRSKAAHRRARPEGRIDRAACTESGRREGLPPHFRTEAVDGAPRTGERGSERRNE